MVILDQEGKRLMGKANVNLLFFRSSDAAAASSCWP
jgi:hypothetical protein